GTSGVITAGTKPSTRTPPRRPSRNNCRQRYSCERETSCFSAVADTWRPSPEKPSSTIRSFASSVNRRRRPVPTISRRLTVRKLSLSLSIRTKRQIHSSPSRRPRSDAYISGDVTLGYNLDLRSVGTLNLNSGFKYLNLKFDSSGGALTYSVDGFRDVAEPSD